MNPKYVVPLLVVAMAACISACGGGADSTQPATSTDEASTNAAGETSRNSGERSAGPRETASPQSAAFQKYSEKSKLHLAEFGEEGSSDDRREATAALQGYLRARSAAEWKRACSYLSAPSKAELQQLIPQLDGAAGKKGCEQTLPTALKAFAMGDEAGPSSGVASLRLKSSGSGSGGFALYHGTDGHDYWIAVHLEDGRWKLVAISPSDFSKLR